MSRSFSTFIPVDEDLPVLLSVFLLLFDCRSNQFAIFMSVPLLSSVQNCPYRICHFDFLLRVLRSQVIVAFDLCVNTPFDHQCKKARRRKWRTSFKPILKSHPTSRKTFLSTASSSTTEASVSRRSENHSAAADVSVLYAIFVGLINRSGIVKAIYAALLKLRDPLGELKDSYFFLCWELSCEMYFYFFPTKISPKLSSSRASNR